MLFSNILLSFVTLCLLSSTSAYRILVLFPMPAKSHSILGHGVVRHLLEAGHEVIHVTSYPQNEHKQRLKEIHLSNLEKEFTKIKDEMEDFKIKNMVGKKNAADSIVVYLIAQKVHEIMFESEEFMNLLRNPKEQFDAVITEWFFYNGVAGIASVLQCPMIWFSTSEVHWSILKMLDDIPNPAYTADIVSTNYPPLTFWQRISELSNIIWKEIVTSIITAIYEKPFFYKTFSEIAAKRDVTAPSYEKSIYNGSLLLINSHPSFGTPFKLPQNAKYVGGYHVESIVKPLPKELQTIIDKAKDGVIYFSMGSNFRSSDMSEEMISSLLNMFAKLKQTVIWKFEVDTKNIPSNVHLVKWAPQQSILAHSNIKMFITHGGQLSTTEAIHHGVPVIGIPLAADQHVNMNSVTKKSFGIKVTLSENLSYDLNEAIQKILRDISYKAKAKELSIIFHDRPSTPGKEMVYWVEHVIRTRGATHLRSPALMVPWYQKIYLDLLILTCIFLFLICFVLRKIIRIFRPNNKKIVKKLQ